MARTSKSSSGRSPVRRDAVSGQVVGIVDEADARAFRRANAALLKEIRGSKAKAIEVLKASGYLTPSGRVAKRYR